MDCPISTHGRDLVQFFSPLHPREPQDFEGQAIDTSLPQTKKPSTSIEGIFVSVRGLRSGFKLCETLCFGLSSFCGSLHAFDRCCGAGLFAAKMCSMGHRK